MTKELLLFVIIAVLCLGCGNENPVRYVEEPVGKREILSSPPPVGASIDVKKDTQASRPFPLTEGIVGSVDLQQSSITVNYKNGVSKVVKVSKDTRITKNGSNVSLNDAIIGEPVAGLVVRENDGTLKALSLRLGPKQKK